MKHRIALAGVLTAASLAAVACGSSGTPSAAGSSSPTATTTTTTTTSTSAGAGTSAATSDPVAWAGAFCEGMGPMAQGVVEMLQALLAQGGAGDPAAQKAALLQFSQKSGTALSSAADRLGELGPPTPETRVLHDELVKYFDGTGRTLVDANGELAALDPADPQFSAKLEQIGSEAGDPTALREQVRKIQDDPVLGNAFKQAPQCASMGDALKNLGG